MILVHEQDVWFELYEWDGFVLAFVADFDTREAAEEYVSKNEWLSDETKIRRVSGLAA